MNKKKIHFKDSFIFISFISLIVLFMSIGYAAINSISLEISGYASASPMQGLVITDARYSTDYQADLTASKINNIYQTNLSSTIVLTQNRFSYITYEISIYNSTDNDYSYVETAYMTGTNTYDNENIVFTLTNLSTGEIIESGQTKTFKITFSYKNYVIPDNSTLNSILNFKFEKLEEEIVVAAGTLINSGSEDKTFGYPLQKYYLEEIYTVNHKNIPADAIDTWDASVEGNNSIMAWTLDTDGDSLKELYLGTDGGKIMLPQNSSYMFSSYSNVTTIDFNNVDTSLVTDMSYMFYGLSSITTIDFSNFNTSQVTNMNSMFYYSSGFTSLDLSSFDTSNVTNMGYMFYYMYKLTSLDLSSFDTSNVTNISYMFAYSYKIETLKLNNASFGNVTTANMAFYQLPSTVYIIAKDDTARNWIQEKLGSGKGTIVTVAELET